MKNSFFENEFNSSKNIYQNHFALKWKRFINYVMDVFVIQIVFRVLYSNFINPNSNGSADVKVNIYAVCIVLFIYYLFEYYTGKTLEKLITRTKVISIDGEKPTAQQIIYRTLCRIIPFEPFSMFFSFTTWHDDWSDTAVVNDNYK